MTLDQNFRVSCLPRVRDVAAEWRATHVVSLIDPELPDHLVPVIGRGEHIVARLRDQETAAFTSHFPDLIVSLFETVRPAVERPDSRILVHCHAGISRSTAFALCLMAHRLGPGREEDAFAAFLQIVNKPWPNRRIVEIIDGHLGRRGALLAPLDELRQRHPRRIDALHRFNLRRPYPELMGNYGR
jgi:predicted protein tyrosine phosphatase